MCLFILEIYVICKLLFENESYVVFPFYDNGLDNFSVSFKLCMFPCSRFYSTRISSG